MNLTKYYFIPLLSLAVFLSSCVSTTPSVVREGRVTSITRNVQTANQNNAASTGSILGSLAGLVVGEGNGRYLASAGGAIGGRYAGSAVAKNIVIGEVLNYRVQLSAGDTVNVEEKATSTEATYRVGQTVRVVRSGGAYRFTQ
jgi:outer membrane lipoprotein SlyB